MVPLALAHLFALVAAHFAIFSLTAFRRIGAAFGSGFRRGARVAGGGVGGLCGV